MRIDPEVLDALRRWASDDLRSMNAQVEYVLRRALKREGRLKKEATQEKKQAKQREVDRK